MFYRVLNASLIPLLIAQLEDTALLVTFSPKLIPLNDLQYSQLFIGYFFIVKHVYFTCTLDQLSPKIEFFAEFNVLVLNKIFARF